MGFGVSELLLILVIVLLLFGTTKLKSLGSDLGSAIKGFRNALGSDEEKAKLEADPKDVTDTSTEKKTETHKE